MLLRALLLAFLGGGVPFVTPDGMGRAVFPEAVPDHPEGFMITHGDNSYFFKLFPWAEGDTASYFELCKRHTLSQPGGSVREIQAGQVKGLERHVVTGERHRVTREYVANGNLYTFVAMYRDQQQPAEVGAFLDSIEFSPEATNPAHLGRSRLVNCSIRLDGLVRAFRTYAEKHGGGYPTTLQQLVDAHYPVFTTCESGAPYVLNLQADQFTIHCSGQHHGEAGCPADFPRIDQARHVWEAPDKLLRRPDREF
jgi:hypothetical protein